MGQAGTRWTLYETLVDHKYGYKVKVGVKRDTLDTVFINAAKTVRAAGRAGGGGGSGLLLAHPWLASSLPIISLPAFQCDVLIRRFTRGAT